MKFCDFINLQLTHARGALSLWQQAILPASGDRLPGQPGAPGAERELADDVTPEELERLGLLKVWILGTTSWKK